MTKFYLLSVLLSLALAWFIPILILKVIFLWAALSLTIVSFAYIFDRPAIFRKNTDGKIVYWVRWAFIPFLLGIRAYNIWAIKKDDVPPIQKITEHLFLSRRLLPSDLDYLKSQKIECIVDVTAEFSGLESAMTDKHFDYLTIPVLDHKSPSLSKLRHALYWIDTQISQSRSVVIHCALGRGRSVFVMAAYLLSKDPSLTVDQALKKISTIRSSARLNNKQYKVLSNISNQNKLRIPDPTWMIVNPVSGGGKWKQYKQQLIRELTIKYPLKIQMTTKETSALMLTDKAKHNGIKNIIACGGDGTITEVAAEIIHSDITLGIVPFGTANALCHVLYGLEAKVAPVETACKAILSDNIQRIDTAKCNDNLMLLIMGIGFEQKMIESANRDNKNNHGQLAYLSGFFKAVVTDNEIQHLNIKLDDQPYQKLEVQSLVIANTAPFSTLLAHGGNTPEPNDGKLHVTYLEHTNVLSEKIFALSDLALSSIGVKEKATQFKYFSGNTITITSDNNLNYVIDGENYASQFINIKMLPSSLNVRIP